MALRIFWRQCTMSKQVASKAQFQGKKEYRKKALITDFPDGTTEAEGFTKLQDIVGYRPEKPMHIAHAFAELIGSKTVSEIIHPISEVKPPKLKPDAKPN